MVLAWLHYLERGPRSDQKALAQVWLHPWGRIFGTVETYTRLAAVLPLAIIIPVTDLERSHAELRTALMIAGKHIVKLNFGRRDDPILPILRRVLKDARALARKEGITLRIRLPIGK